MTAPLPPPVDNTETTQALVEQPVPADRVVHDYGSTWLLYILVAGVFLAMLYRLIRRWPKWLLVPVWSMFAAGALTPAASTPDGPWLAPAAIVAILGAEKDGITGLMRGATPILLSFVALNVLLGGLFWWLAKRPQPAAAAEQDSGEADLKPADNAALSAEPARQEPKL